MRKRNKSRPIARLSICIEKAWSHLAVFETDLLSENAIDAIVQIACRVNRDAVGVRVRIMTSNKVGKRVEIVGSDFFEEVKIAMDRNKEFESKQAGQTEIKFVTTPISPKEAVK